MLRGTRHDLAGLLLRSGRDHLLEISGGGTWRLDMGPLAAERARDLAGLRVRATGVRDGFDLLAVDPIEQDVATVVGEPF